jgi:hypothetical protein
MMIEFLKAVLWCSPDDPVTGDPALRPGGQVARHLRQHVEVAVEAVERQDIPLALKIAVLEVSQCYLFLLTRTWPVIGGVAELGVGAPRVARRKFALVPEYLVKPRQ